MNRLTDNDKNWGPFTLARWRKHISFKVCSGDEEDPECLLLVCCFGWALRLMLPSILQPLKDKYGDHPREFGFSVSNQGSGFDFLQVFYGPQTHDSSTTKSWSKFLPWTQWDCVRHSVYNPDGSHFGTQPKVKGGYNIFCKMREACPTVQFEFEDFDGKVITATCKITEREWHRGEGWFKWLKYFWPAKTRRSLDLRFSSEVGPEKGSWKGGTTGHGIDMLPGETPEQAFRRYCDKEHRARHDRKYRIKFLRSIPA